MRLTRWLLPAGVLFTVSCATAPPPAPQTAAPRPETPRPQETVRKDLEDAYTGILARQHVVSAPEVDIDAAASIAIPQHPTIDGALRYFSTGLREKIQASLARGAQYRTMIDATLEEHRLPKALAYLPVIESAFLPTLTSRAGAHGLWQFMPETAREYGLRVDWWVDDRADPERSTRAAAEYLSDLHRQFGDWSLALAAYNCGPGRVRRAMNRTGATSFWDLLELAAVPKETRNYVPTFFATVRIAGEPEAHGFRLDRATDPDDATVEVEGPVSLEYVATVAGVDEKRLRSLNPALHRGLVPPGRRAIRVPSNVAPLVAERAATLKEEDNRIAVASFRVRKGDSITSLAKKLGTTADTILAMNDLSKKQSIRAGRSIYLPVPPRQLGSLLRHADDEDVYYTVRKGDTLYSIAKRHRLTVGEVRELNDLDGTALQPGQKLRVSPPRSLTAGSM